VLGVSLLKMTIRGKLHKEVETWKVRNDFFDLEERGVIAPYITQPSVLGH